MKLSKTNQRALKIISKTKKGFMSPVELAQKFGKSSHWGIGRFAILEKLGLIEVQDGSARVKNLD